MNNRVISLIILLSSAFAISCARIEAQKLISEMNVHRTQCQELTKQAHAKADLARKQSAAGQHAEYQKTMQEEADLYGQIATRLNMSADEGEQVVKLTTTDWYKEYFTLYTKWTRDLAKMAAGAQQELLVRKDGAPSEDQLQKWKANGSQMKQEVDALQTQIAKIEAEHKAVPILHD